MTRLDGRNTLPLPERGAHSFQPVHSLTAFSSGLLLTNCQVAGRPLSLNEQRSRLGICLGFDPRIHGNNGRLLKDIVHVASSHACHYTPHFLRNNYFASAHWKKSEETVLAHSY